MASTAASFSEKRLGEILVDNGVVSAADLAEVLEVQAERGGRLGELMVAQKLVEEEQLLRALGEQLHLEVLESVNDTEIPDDLVTAVPIV